MGCTVGARSGRGCSLPVAILPIYPSISHPVALPFSALLFHGGGCGGRWGGELIDPLRWMPRAASITPSPPARFLAHKRTTHRQHSQWSRTRKLALALASTCWPLLLRYCSNFGTQHTLSFQPFLSRVLFTFLRIACFLLQSPRQFYENEN